MKPLHMYYHMIFYTIQCWVKVIFLDSLCPMVERQSPSPSSYKINIIPSLNEFENKQVRVQDLLSAPLVSTRVQVRQDEY